MERDSNDGKVTFCEFYDNDEIEIESLEDAFTVINLLGDMAVTLSERYGHVVYPIFRVN